MTDTEWRWEVHRQPSGRALSVGPYLVLTDTPVGQLSRHVIRSLAYLRGVTTPETFWKYLADLCRLMARDLVET